MTRNDTQQLGCDEKLFKQVVKTTFNQRRKTLRNSIKNRYWQRLPADRRPSLSTNAPSNFFRTGVYRIDQSGGNSIERDDRKMRN